MGGRGGGQYERGGWEKGGRAMLPRSGWLAWLWEDRAVRPHPIGFHS